LTLETGADMKFFPLKSAIACLVLTPLLYIITFSAFQQYLDKHYLQTFQNIIVGDSRPLLNGSIHIEEQIANNIHAYLKQDFMVQNAGLDIEVRVTTRQGKIIYPLYIDTEYLVSEINKGFDSETITSKNFEILNIGLEVKVQINLNHGSTLANLILFLYSIISLFIFFIFYKIGSKKAEQNRKAEKKLIKDLKKEEQTHQEMLEELNGERQGLFENIKALNAKYQTDKKKAEINEEEMFKEIISLEKQLNSFIELKKRRETEIDDLKSTLQKYERRKGSKLRRNEFDFQTKRFSTIYKNLEMNRKALAGFFILTEDQQIKAEEIIYQLNQNPENIIVKRKVFSGKKHKTACLEVLFAYNGRLYFRNLENKIEVVVIGTKNTQTKDMEFLHNL
jgi:large-conductance mechanosensitive channel